MDSSTNSLLFTPNEASLSMFCANEETWVDFLPQFTLEEPMTLLNGRSVGPWQAAEPARLPLWMARHLQSKALGTIAPPSAAEDNWMQVESLREILNFERSHETLWVNSHHHKNALVDNNEEEDDSDPRQQQTATQKPYLPERYWELSQCYSTADNGAAVAVLIQDLWQVRLDKLRRQFQLLYSQNEPLQAVNVTGIGTAELAVMRQVIAQALTQKAALQRSATLPSKQPRSAATPQQQPTSSSSFSAQTETVDATAASTDKGPARPRAAIRRFRKAAAPADAPTSNDPGIQGTSL